MGEKLEGMVLPKTPSIARKRSNGAAGNEARARGIEIAALAFVAMENGDYVYPQGIRSGNRVNDGVNYSELMRLAGYRSKSISSTDFHEYLGDKREFRQLVELYRLRRTDPMFGKAMQSKIIGEIAGKLTQELYEAIQYYPHTLTFRDKLTALKTLVELGYRITADGAQKDDRASRLLDSLPAEQREVALAGLKAKAESEIASIDALQLAHKAADDGH